MSGSSPDLKKAGSCPDPDRLCAAAQGQLTGDLCAAVETHVAQCANCSDLLQRLRQFHYGATPVDPDWQKTEKRMDSRIQEFLATPKVSESTRRVPWRTTPMLAPVAATAAVVIYCLARPAAPPALPAISSMAKNSTVAEAPLPQIPREVSIPEPGEAERLATLETPLPTDHPSVANPLLLQGVTRNPVEPEPPGAPVPVLPASVRINPGTRVWILLQSTSPEKTGGFSFRGMVLLPVMQGGTVLLDRETQVIGTGTADPRRTTIRIAEFVWQGSRYRLKSSRVAPGNGETGAGPAVQFSAGQVLETWLASASVYERVSGEATPR